MSACCGGQSKSFYQKDFQIQTALLSFFYKFFFKGKMGITYPRSLKYYDLRQRYPRPNQGTRAAIEQVEHP